MKDPFRLNKLQWRIVMAGAAAALVVVAAVVFAALDWAIPAAALSIYAMGAGAWLFYAIERYLVAKRVNTVIEANRLNPVRHVAKPLLPVMAAVIGLTQAVVRALTDVADLERPPPDVKPRAVKPPVVKPPRPKPRLPPPENG